MKGMEILNMNRWIMLVLSMCIGRELAAAPDWVQTTLGAKREDVPLTLPSEEAVTVKAIGRESYVGRDEGAFVGFETDEPAFVFTARVAGTTDLPANAKVGIAIREGLRGTDRCVNLRYDGYELNRCVQWFARLKIRPGQAGGSHACFRDGLIKEAKELEGLWFRLERAHPFIRMSWSEDGKVWNEVPHQAALLNAKVWVGLQVTAGIHGGAGSVTFDSISFEIGKRKAASFEGVKLPKREWDMHVVRVEHPAKGSFNPFLLMPKGMKPEDVKGVVLSSGSKEVQLDAGALEFESGPKTVKGKLRKPKGMADFEGGVYTYTDGNYHGVLLEQMGVIRLGGAWPPEVFPLAVKALEEKTGVPLSRLPIFPTGASFAGGYSAKFAHLYPDQITAAAPTLLGLTGFGWQNPAYKVPHLHIIGEKDGGHLKDILRGNARLREQKARWGGAVMWTLGHRHSEADALIYPWFFSFLGNDPAYEDGWYGDLTTWKTSAPVIQPVAEFKGDNAEMTWLPSEKLARIWQAFVSFKPHVMIQYPTFDGYAPFMGPNKQTCTVLKAEEPFPIVASGPLADDLKLELWNGDQLVDGVLSEEENPYALTHPGLPEGMHTLILKVEIKDRTVISKPVMVLVIP